MLIDTHCHINMMVKKNFDTLINSDELLHAQQIAHTANQNGITTIINVGTSLIESKNCISIAQQCPTVFATIGIHPNDLTDSWKSDIQELKKILKNKKENKIVGIGECGLDFHYPDYNILRQKDAFKIQIEISLEHDIALVVHTRDARDQTLRALEEYKNQITRGIIHCFSEDLDFAQTVIDWGFAIGIGGTLTYPKNNGLRRVATSVPLESIVLETDAPFLPIQTMRGKQNDPRYIKNIADYLAQLRNERPDHVAAITSARAFTLFNLK